MQIYVKKHKCDNTNSVVPMMLSQGS